MKIIKSCARILARARFVPRRLSSGRDRNFSTVLPSGFDIFGTRAASSSASGSTSKYNRANICPRREATAERSVARPRYFGLFSIHIGAPIQLFALPRVGSGSKGLIFGYRPSVCPPDELSKLDYYYAARGGRETETACLADETRLHSNLYLWKLLVP